MPIYTYQCQHCGVQFEKHQKFDDKPLTRCPECSKGRVRRIVQPSAIVFRGSGWYKTDHRSGSGSSSTAAKPAKSPSADGEAKPAAKSEPAASTSSDD